ncbi:MAG TPA: peptidyl-prolyl cis-trans isomerase [Thermoanaerobaculia bacterium]
MRRTLPSLALAVLLLAPAGLRAEVINKVVLRVNEQIATLYDYEQRRQELVRELTRRELDPEERQRLLANAPEIVFKDIYQDLLLRSRADQLAIEVNEAQVDAALAQMRQSYGIKTDEEFRAALASSGMVEAQLRSQIRHNLRMRQVMEREVGGRIDIKEEDLRRYYRKNVEQFRVPEQLHLREVVVLEEGGLPTAEERARVASEIRQAVAGGKSLADAAAAHPGTTSNVIELGWVSPGDLDPGLESAVWKLQAGALSEPVAGRGGLHLLEVIERRESRIQPFNEVAATIQTREQERVYNQELAKYLNELEKKSLVVADPPQEAAGFRRLIDQPVPEASDLGALIGSPTTAPATETTGAPGALPQAKPVDTTPPPVVETPAAAPSEPPPSEKPPAGR